MCAANPVAERTRRIMQMGCKIDNLKKKSEFWEQSFGTTEVIVLEEVIIFYEVIISQVFMSN